MGDGGWGGGGEVFAGVEEADCGCGEGGAEGEEVAEGGEGGVAGDCEGDGWVGC